MARFGVGRKEKLHEGRTFYSVHKLNKSYQNEAEVKSNYIVNLEK